MNTVGLARFCLWHEPELKGNYIDMNATCGLISSRLFDRSGGDAGKQKLGLPGDLLGEERGSHTWISVAP